MVYPGNIDGLASGLNSPFIVDVGVVDIITLTNLDQVLTGEGRFS